MPELTILSPHRDDAAFSLSLALSCWSKLRLKVTIVNFFTISNYAPHAVSTRALPISALRTREDYSVLLSINRRIRIEAFDLLDAPLRFGIEVNAIALAETAALQSTSEINVLAQRLRKYFTRGLVLAPLALGDHVDHLAVHRAALASSVDHKLGFYEDLPYATWTPKSVLCEKLCRAEESTNVDLKGAVIRSHKFTVAHKRQLIKKYQSQISPDEASAIANYAWNYGGGERIWIPKYGASWKSLLQ